MKKKIILVACIVSLSFSCHLPVLTKDQTLKEIVGKWDHVDLKKSDMKNIVFTNKKDKAGNYIYIWTYQKKDTNGNMYDTGSWRYAGVGKIEISDIDNVWILHFSFIDTNTLALENDDMYKKGQ